MTEGVDVVDGIRVGRPAVIPLYRPAYDGRRRTGPTSKRRTVLDAWPFTVRRRNRGSGLCRRRPGRVWRYTGR
jgi:hypothetical protein